MKNIKNIWSLSLFLLSFSITTAMERQDKDLEETKKHYNLFCIAYASDFKDRAKNDVLLTNPNDPDLSSQVSFKRNNKDNTAEAYINFLNTMLTYSTCKNEVGFYNNLLNSFINPNNNFFILQWVTPQDPLYSQALLNEQMLKETMTLLGGTDVVLKKETYLPKRTIFNDYYVYAHNIVSFKDKQLPLTNASDICKWIKSNKILDNKLELLAVQHINLLPFNNGISVKRLEETETYGYFVNKIYEDLGKKMVTQNITSHQYELIMDIRDQIFKSFMGDNNAFFYDNFSVYALEFVDFNLTLKNTCLNYLFFEKEIQSRKKQKELNLVKKDLKKELEIQKQKIKDEILECFDLLQLEKFINKSTTPLLKNPSYQKYLLYFQKTFIKLNALNFDYSLEELLKIQDYQNKTEKAVNHLLNQITTIVFLTKK